MIIHPALDSALSVLREGNRFITNRCLRYETDIFQTNLLFKKTFCMRGEEAARLFYSRGKLTRVGAMPVSVLGLLQDKGSVATLNDVANQHRKRMFMSLMAPDHIEQLINNVEKSWIKFFLTQKTNSKILLFDALQEILLDAICDWCGIPPGRVAVKQRAREIAATIDGAGAIGYRNWRGALLSRRTEQWLEDIIKECRAGLIKPRPESALNVISFHKKLSRNLLDSKVAAVELLNIIRPTVATARFTLFAALALHEHPGCKEKLQSGDKKYAGCFEKEVRRFYPFFPFIGGIVRESFEWQGQNFAPGVRLLLDVYGTNHDPKLWQEPYTFKPERFLSWDKSPFNFILQGGGDYFSGYRCAGEHVTIALLERSLELLVNYMKYDVEDRDYSMNMSRMPALPKQDFIIKNISIRIN